MGTPSPRLMPTPTTATTWGATTVLDTDSVTTDTVLVTTDTPVLDTTATTARGLLMLSPLPLLRPIPTTDTTDLDTVATDTVLDTVATTVATTARGPLTPSSLPPLMPRLIPTTDTTALDTTDTDTPVLDTAPTDTVLATMATAMVCTDTTDKCPADSNHPKTSLGTTSSEKWIVQFGSFPTSATSFSATRLAQARNGEQEATENQNVMIRRIKKY